MITIFDNYHDSERTDFDAYVEYVKENDPDRDYDEEPVTDKEVYSFMASDDEFGWESDVGALKKFMAPHKVLFIGTVGRWNGRFDGAKVGDFEKLLGDALSDCDYVRITDRRGRLFVEGDHHDGHVSFEVLILTDAGEQAHDDWEGWVRFNDYQAAEWFPRLAKSRHFSRLPHFAKLEWGCRESA